MQRKQLVALVLAASLWFVGCGPKKHPTMSTKPNASSSEMTSPDQRMSELQQRAAELDAVARQLPGRDVKSDRELVAQAFDRSSAALTLLGGPEPGGAFRQELRIVDNVRQELKTLSTDISADPTVDSGLRSIHHALVSVRERLFPDDPQVKQVLDVVGERTADLDVVRGPMHSLVVAQVFSATATTIQTMATEMSGRAAASASPATPPATPTAPVAPARIAPSAPASAAPVAPTPAATVPPASAAAPAAPALTAPAAR